MIYFLSFILALLPAYLIRLKIYSLPTTFLELLIVVFLFATVVSGFIRSDKLKDRLIAFKRLGKINYAIGLFILAGIISVIVSPEKMKALGQLKAFIVEPVLLFYAVIITIRSKEQLNIVLRWLFVSTFAISLFGIFQYFSYINLPLKFWGNGDEVERITSVFEHPNALSLYLAPLIGFFTALWLSNYSFFKNRWVTLAGLVVMAIAILLTFSRGAWLALAVGLFLIILQKYKTKQVIIPAIAILILLTAIPGVRQRLSLGISDASNSARLGYMQTGVQQIAKSPIFGSGLAGFTALKLDVEYPHNIILNFWVQMGLLGLISFLAVCFLVFEKHKKTPSALTLASGAFVLIIILHGMVDTPYFKNDLAILFWFAVAVAYI